MTIESLINDVTQATVLRKIIQDKQTWLIQQQALRPLAEFKDKVTASDRYFYQALTQTKPVFILECKKASPSKGLIRSDFDPKAIAQVYKNYASAISVLTDEKYFQGSFEFLPIVRSQVQQPVLCKDFIIDEYQVYLARYYQADAILLMLSVLDDNEYQQLSQLAHQLNMGVLTEASTEDEVKRAVNLQAKVIGINNRNLRDLTVDLNRVKHLAPLIPDDVVIISESGIYTHQQVQALSPYANGFLIGSALMSDDNLTLAVRKVVLGENKVCGLTQPQDAIVAYQAGAVYGGLIFVSTSPRYIEPNAARSVISAAPLNWVGVFRNEPIENVTHIAQVLGLFAVQLHGDEDAHYIEQLRQQLPADCQIWQAVSIKDQVPAHHHPLVNRYIFDQGQGGTGQAFNWQLLKDEPLDNVILAGGINPDNVLSAQQIGCLGLDINSGVETHPGKKDMQKLAQLFNQLHPLSVYKRDKEQNNDQA